MRANGLLAAGAALLMSMSFGSASQAQVSFEFGVGPRADIYRRDGFYDRSPVIERRVERPGRVYRRDVIEDDEDCRVIVRRSVDESGRMIRRRITVCE
jgi:hypothetical protein